MLEELVNAYGLNKLITVRQDGSRSVTPVGIARICDLIDLPTSKWPSGFSTDLVTPTGTFARRLRDWCDDWHRPIKDQLSEVGRIAEANSTASAPLYFDITDEILSWKSGRFRDSGSCYRGSYASSVPNLKSLGAHTLRLFRPGGGPSFNFYGNFIGAGRVFLVPSGNGTMVLMNHYGFGGAIDKFATMVIQAATQAGIDAEWYYCDFDIDGTDVYINDSSTVAVCKKGVKHRGSITVKGKETWRHGSCGNCNKRIFYKKQSRQFCEECGDKCSKCGGEYVHFYMTYIGDKKAWVCNNCKGSMGLIENPCGKVNEKEICECEVCNGAG